MSELTYDLRNRIVTLLNADEIPDSLVLDIAMTVAKETADSGLQVLVDRTHDALIDRGGIGG